MSLIKLGRCIGTAAIIIIGSYSILPSFAQSPSSLWQGTGGASPSATKGQVSGPINAQVQKIMSDYATATQNNYKAINDSVQTMQQTQLEQLQQKSSNLAGVTNQGTSTQPTYTPTSNANKGAPANIPSVQPSAPTPYWGGAQSATPAPTPGGTNSGGNSSGKSSTGWNVQY